MDEIYWIENNNELRFAIVPRPQGGAWLKDELRDMREKGIQTVVSMLEAEDAMELGLRDEESLAKKAGLQFLSYPIPDGEVPGNIAAFRRFASGLARRLQKGEAIGVHCRGCIGRATIAAACTLIHLGWDPQRALDAIEQARGMSVPDNPEQEKWILRYKPNRERAR